MHRFRAGGGWEGHSVAVHPGMDQCDLRLAGGRRHSGLCAFHGAGCRAPPLHAYMCLGGLGQTYCTGSKPLRLDHGSPCDHRKRHTLAPGAATSPS